jgi:hypothetical protein
MPAKAPPRRFEAKQETILRDLKATMTKLKATGLRVEQDLMKGGATIIFDRGGKRYTVECSTYSSNLDNLRAAQLTIEYLWRAMEHYGATMTEKILDRQFARFFLGFEATPDDSALLLGGGETVWWDVLGVPQGADKGTITNAFRALAKVHHPDAGGNVDDFKRLRSAYEQGLREAEKR